MVVHVYGVSMKGAPSGVVTLMLQFGPPQDAMKEKYRDEDCLHESEMRISERQAKTGPRRGKSLGASSERTSLKC